jgi:uncharacterized protein YegP (UPF0339 family)
MNGTIYIYKDHQSQYRWRFRAPGNHEIMAVSGEAYVSKYDCQQAIQKLKRWFPAAPVVDTTV